MTITLNFSISSFKYWLSCVPLPSLFPSQIFIADEDESEGYVLFFFFIWFINQPQILFISLIEELTNI